MSGDRERRRAALKALGFLFYALATALVLAEIAAQIFFRSTFGESPASFGAATFKHVERYMTDHPYLPYIATQGDAVINEGLWQDPPTIHFNSLGDRGPEPDQTKGRIRVIAFGGSTTFGARSHLAETWPAQLEALLGSEEYEVINAAQNGATTADTLVNLALIHIDLNPDYVLVYHGTNDLEASYTREFKSDYSHRRRDIANVPPIFEALPRWLDHSAVFVLTRNALLGGRAQGDLWSRYTRSNDMDLENGPFGLDTFRRNLRSTIALARTRGARVVLGTFQYRKQWAELHRSAAFANAWERGIALENEIIRDLARHEEGVFLADVAAAFEPSEETLWDFCHLTARGNREVAKEFHRALTQDAQARETHVSRRALPHEGGVGRPGVRGSGHPPGPVEAGSMEPAADE